MEHMDQTKIFWKIIVKWWIRRLAKLKKPKKFNFNVITNEELCYIMQSLTISNKFSN